MNLIETIQRMRAIGAPILAIQTPDQLTTVQTLRIGLNGASPILSWDCVAGVQALNKPGAEAIAALELANDPSTITNPKVALVVLSKLAPKSIVLFINAARFIDDTGVLQAVMNIRDAFKADNRVLVLLSPSLRLPAELQADVLTVDEPLPTPAEVGAIVREVYKQNEITHDDALITQATDALRGLAGFSIEQAASMAYDPKADSIEVADMWTRKRKQIETVRGLGFERPAIGFPQIGGLTSYKEFMRKLSGRYRCVLLLDEFEKVMAGAGGAHSVGDSSGTSQDSAETFLKEMEDRGYEGHLNYGPAGSGKTYAARAAAAEWNIPLIPVDFGAAKGSLVGESEARVRDIWRTIHAIAGDKGAYVIGAVNSLVNLSGPMRRRFCFGVWFFDLCDADERVAVGKLQSESFHIKDAPEFWRAANGWSGANIRDCCRLAEALKTTVKDASRYIVATGKQDPESIRELRKSAANRYLSASYAGEYQMPKDASDAIAPTQTPNVRKFERGN